MNLKECYKAMGADYEDVIRRLMSERLVEKFVLKFLDDGSFSMLCEALEAGDWEQAFRAAHTLKGVSQNLSLTRLGESSSALTEALRNHTAPEDPALFAQVKEDYEKAVQVIRE